MNIEEKVEEKKVEKPCYPSLQNAILKDNCYIHFFQTPKNQTRVVEVIKKEAPKNIKKTKKEKTKNTERTETDKLQIKGYGESYFLTLAFKKADLSYSRGGLIEEFEGRFGAAGSEGGIDMGLHEGIDVLIEKEKLPNTYLLDEIRKELGDDVASKLEKLIQKGKITINATTNDEEYYGIKGTIKKDNRELFTTIGKTIDEVLANMGEWCYELKKPLLEKIGVIEARKK